MFKLTCNIVKNSKLYAKRIQVKYVKSIVVDASIKQLTATAKVTLPRKLYCKGTNITEYIRRNDTIQIYAGYDYGNKLIFDGFITTVSTGTPIIIECENRAWVLKQTKLPGKIYPKFNLKSFCDEVLPGWQKNITDVELGEVKINSETSIASVFDYLMKHYPVNFFFRERKLYGILGGSMLLSDDVQEVHKFKIGTNIISDSLNYTLAEDVKLQIVAKAILKDNTKLEHKEPADAEGCDVRTFLVPGATSVSELQTYAKEMLQTYKVDKMTGSFTCFGEPHVEIGDIVHIYDDKHPEMNNKKFLVESIKYTFARSGYRQVVNLGYEIK